MPGPLNDIRVVDFTHALNGPFCTMLLGHLGAEIIKIEPPQGDNFRRSWMAPDAGKDGYEFLWINVNKKSVVLNLKTERGVELARDLIARADVLVENYQKGTMERFGLDYESIKEANPRLIYACSRGYGEWGPYSDYGNTAATNNSMTGWTHTAWEYAGAEGTKSLGIGDEAAGVSMTVGILAALHARERTGEGQRIVVSMQEAVLGFMVSSMHEHFTGNMVGNTPMQVADGYFTLRIPHLGDGGWSRLAERMGRPELATDPRFADAAARREHKDELDQCSKGLGAHPHPARAVGRRARSRLLRRAGAVDGGGPEGPPHQGAERLHPTRPSQRGTHHAAGAMDPHVPDPSVHPRRRARHRAAHRRGPRRPAGPHRGGTDGPARC